MLDYLGSAINWIFSLPYIKSSYFIFLGSLAVVIGGWRNTYEQNVHNDSVTAANKQVKADTVLLKNDLQEALTGIKEAEKGINQTLVEIKNTTGNITGGNSIPQVTNQFNDFYLKHHSGDFPLFDVKVSIREYWHPDENEDYPEGYWYMEYYPGGISIPNNMDRWLVESKLQDIVMPNAGSITVYSASDQTTSIISKSLFPETNRAYYRISIAARNGNFVQFIALRNYSNPDGSLVMHQQNLLHKLETDNQSIEISKTGEWEEYEGYEFEGYNIVKHGLYYPVWPEELESSGVISVRQ